MRIVSGIIARAALFAWLAVIVFDFALHAGVLAGLYEEPQPFLLSPESAFRLIPLGYASFALFCLLLAWVMSRTGVRGNWPGLGFGLLFGVLAWGSWCLALASISTAPHGLLLAWFLGQGLEAGVAGFVAGAVLAGARLRPLAGWLVGWLVLCAIAGVVLQNV